MAWFGPVVKAIVPHVGSIIAAARPAFTKRKSSEAARAHFLHQQIEELQSAASQNAVHSKALAEQLQKSIVALEKGAALAEARSRRTTALCIGAIVPSCIALGFSMIALFGR